jgi:hypothetical protein
MRVIGWAIAAVLGLSGPVMADKVFEFPEDEDEASFIADEVIATFYHELGHALIDVLQLPVLGKEEDAADNLSVILMNDIWDEESAAEILTSDATSYALMAAQAEAGGEEPVYWDVHSLDLQRYYTVVCLFYGANPEMRAQLAKDLELPDERAEQCPEEYQQASDSWYAVLEGTDPGGDNVGLKMAPGQKDVPLADLLADEVASINESFGLPEQVTVVVADCGEANAYYNPEDRSITMCNEYAENLQQMWEAE